MPQPQTRIAIDGTSRITDDGLVLILSTRLRNLDTFLTGVLETSETQIPVRITSLDDVTVLQPLEPLPAGSVASTWWGLLDVSHGQRVRTPPADLVTAATGRGRSLAALDSAELRYALTFLGEATTPAIRAARIDAIVGALPSGHGDAA